MFSIGDKVRYYPHSSNGYPHILEAQYEKGIVKSHPEIPGCVYVVFKCGDDWDNYQNYTANLTKITKLRLGWEDYSL